MPVRTDCPIPHGEVSAAQHRPPTTRARSDHQLINALGTHRERGSGAAAAAQRICQVGQAALGGVVGGVPGAVQVVVGGIQQARHGVEGGAGGGPHLGAGLGGAGAARSARAVGGGSHGDRAGPGRAAVGEARPLPAGLAPPPYFACAGLRRVVS